MTDMWSSVGSFALVAALVTLTPGLDTALVLRSAIAHGHRAGYAASAGIAAGLLAWGLASAFGVTVLLTASRTAYDAVRFSGAAYMVWLGARFVLRAIRGDDLEHDRGTTPPTDAQAFRQGLVTNLLNPKIGAFYVAVLPQFLPADTPAAVAGSLLACTHVIESLLWFSVLILAAHRMRATLSHRSVRRTVDGVAGAALIGFGAKLAAG